MLPLTRIAAGVFRFQQIAHSRTRLIASQMREGRVDVCYLLEKKILTCSLLIKLYRKIKEDASKIPGESL